MLLSLANENRGFQIILWLLPVCIVTLYSGNFLPTGVCCGLYDLLTVALCGV